MPNVSGHTELVGLMAYPIRHTQSPTTHNWAYDKLGCDVIQLAFEVDNDTLKDSVQAIRSLKMLGSNISMPNKTVVHQIWTRLTPLPNCAAQLTPSSMSVTKRARSPATSRATTPTALASGRQ